MSMVLVGITGFVIMLALMLIGSAVIYFAALWASGLKFRQFARK